MWITTKSNLVTRDIDVLKEVSRRHYLSISLTITTLDADLVCEMSELDVEGKARAQDVVAEMTAIWSAEKTDSAITDAASGRHTDSRQQ